MASEPTDEQTVTVSLPVELHQWLDEQATSLGLDRETVLVQLLASYRMTAQLEADGELGITGDGERAHGIVEEEYIEELVATALADQLEDELSEQAIADAAERVVDDRVTDATDAVEQTLVDRIDDVESEFQAKLDDVRERVIQVKREADQKAPTDHTHDEFDTIDGLAEEVADLEATLDTLRDDHESTASDHETAIDDLSARLDTLEDRLQTVAWAVSDLRDAYESGQGLEAVERIKRAAAKADIERATCENCGNGVTLSLLTDPECPHCNATVSDVQPSSGWFGSPKLLVAAQLESGETR